MKIYEVITPEQQDLFEVWYNPLTWGGAGNAATVAKQAKTNAAAIQAAKDAASKFKDASPAVQKVLANISATATTEAKAASRVALSAKVGNMMHLLTALGAVAITIELYYNWDAIEKQYNAGDLNKAQYKEAHEAYFGLWVIQFMVPWLARILGIAKILAIFVRIIVGVLTLGSSALTGGATFFASVAGLVIEQAIFTGIQAFMMTKTFETWMAQHFFTTLVTIGTIPDESWNVLRGYLTKIPGVDKLVKNPGDDFYTSQDKNRPANIRAKDTSDDVHSYSDPKAIVINGVVVADGKGKIDDYALMGPFVKNYIDLNPDDPNVQKLKALQKK